MIEIKKSGADDVPKVNILVYGQAGTGKTTLLGTAEPRFKSLIIDAEAGLLSLKKRAAEISALTGKKFEFDTYPIKSLDDLVKVKDYLYNEKHDYKFVGLDSGTELQKVIIDKILELKKRDEMQQKDWGTLLNKMVSVIRSFRDLPDVSFLLTALEERSGDGDEVKIVPAFDGRIKQTIDGYFDQVFYSFSKEIPDPEQEGKMKTIYRLCTQNTGKTRGKDRSGNLPKIIEPDFCKIYDTIKGVNQ